MFSAIQLTNYIKICIGKVYLFFIHTYINILYVLIYMYIYTYTLYMYKVYIYKVYTGE